MSDYDPPQAFRRSMRCARKAHRCCECGREIRPGAMYEYASGVWDGEPSAYKTCIGCATARNILVNVLGVDAVSFRGMCSALEEHWRELRSGILRRYSAEVAALFLGTVAGTLYAARLRWAERAEVRRA